MDRVKSTLTSVFIEWQEGVQGDIPVLGYELYMIELATGEVTRVYNGASNEDVKQYSVNGLHTGSYYSFYVVATNFNTRSEASAELVVSVCLPPNHIDSPYRITSTKETITVGWDTPEYLGGCPTLGYSLFMDDGLSGFVEVDALQVNNKPYSNHHTITGLPLLGSYYKFKVAISNEIGSVMSLEADILLSDVPDKPDSVPT